ncbi:MAG TPA: STAS domain-containing protein [Ilumatobacteraceae bacterium]
MNDELVDLTITSLGGVITVALRGEMDAHTSPALQRALDHLLDPKMRVRIDLSGVRFIDSRGLQVLLVQTTRFRDGGGRLEIANASAFTHRVMAYAGLSGVLNTVEERTLEAS